MNTLLTLHLALAPADVAHIALAVIVGGLFAVALLCLKQRLNPWLEQRRAKEALRLAAAAAAAEAERERWLAEAPARDAARAERIAAETARQRAEDARLASLPPTSMLCIAGWLLLVSGAFLLIHFLAVYDVSVPTHSASSLLPERVVNAARMQDRFIGIILGVVIAFSGGLCLIADQVRPKAPETKPQPQANEAVSV
jgi:hypothetical protein